MGDGPLTETDKFIIRQFLNGNFAYENNATEIFLSNSTCLDAEISCMKMYMAYAKTMTPTLQQKILEQFNYLKEAA